MMIKTGSGFTSHLKGDLCWGDSVPILNEETKAIWSYWMNKRTRQRTTTAHKFLLSATDTVQLLNDASITVNDIGRHPHQYQLARHNDTGDYEMGNCRFTTVKDNIAEKDAVSAAMSKRKRTHTPQGTYNSLSEAARENNTLISTMSYRIKSQHEGMKGYYYVE